MRACAINPEVARILGIKVERMVAAGFILSAALGAIGGILITPTQYTAFHVGVPFAVSGFIAAIIGGLGNPLGAFIGGIGLGVLQSARRCVHRCRVQERGCVWHPAATTVRAAAGDVQIACGVELRIG